jgi:hypothetical protein
VRTSLLELRCWNFVVGTSLFECSYAKGDVLNPLFLLVLFDLRLSFTNKQHIRFL